jgi:RecA-family ATPase
MSAKVYQTSAERIAAWREKQRLNGNTVEQKAPVQLPHMETFLEKADRLAAMEKQEEDPILDGVFIPKAINIMYAYGGIGKSSLMLYLAEKWSEMDCSGDLVYYQLLSVLSCRKKRKVLFVDYELTDDDYQLKEIKNNVIHVERPSFESLILTLDTVQPDIVIIDNLSCLIKNPNDFKEVTKVMYMLKKYETRMTIILIGHTPKEGQSLYGSIQQRNIASSSIHLSKYKEFYVLRVEKYRRKRKIAEDDALIMVRNNNSFEYKGTVNYEILLYGKDELQSDYNTIMASLEKNSILQTCKNYNLTRKEVSHIKRLGTLLNENISSYWFLDEEPTKTTAPQNESESDPTEPF